MNCPIIEISPCFPLDIPLDILSLIGGSSSDRVKIINATAVGIWDREEFFGNLLVVARKIQCSPE